MSNIDLSSWDAGIEDAMIPNTNLMLVDALNLAFRYKHKNAKDFAADYIKTINSLAKSYHAAKVIVLTDFKGSSYRKELHPLYKSDRKKQFENQTEEEKQASDEFFAEFNKALDMASQAFTLVKLEKVEADDVATFFVEAFEDGEHFDHIWLISTDKDWDELLGENVSRFSYTTRREYTLDNFYEHHACDTPEQYTSIKAIMGDQGDSVYGVDGIGEKRAYNLVRQYGSVFDIADLLPIEGKQLYIQKLNESYDKLLLNAQLVDLRGWHREAIAHPDPENITYLESIVSELKEKFHATY
ncbi:flap endonuclease [Vibrio phage phi 3]|uniref:Flap endonuclease n=1 Tax=Vibrio phage phi 3 TaxID=1589298 RepID=A0A0B5H902_9CAUD|nr:flap endonuclease [Vibrio phage phi 3]AJF40888.1 flap endonuclease [Vibrio phage phi 3]